MVGRGFAAGGPRTTVVVAAYNQHDWIQLVLAGLAAQTDPAFDVIVADDGSQPPMTEVVERLRPQLPFPLRCLWQDDRGFRKSRIQNLAVLHSDAELFVFLDGDCVPFRNLLEVYRSRAVPDEFLAGAVSYLDQASTDGLTPEAVRAGEHERSLPWREVLRLRHVHWRNLRHAGGKQTRPRLKGGNFAVAASLFARVDGFDEVYCGYAKEDSDLRNRMRNAGARGVSLWHRARACHLSWTRPFGRGREYPPPALYEEGRRRVRARIGLSSHRAEEPERAGLG